MKKVHIESLNGRMWDELLNKSLFSGTDHARPAITVCGADFNTARLHSRSAGYQAPAAYAGVLIATNSSAAQVGGSALLPAAYPALNGATEETEAPIATG